MYSDTVGAFLTLTPLSVTIVVFESILLADHIIELIGNEMSIYTSKICKYLGLKGNKYE